MNWKNKIKFIEFNCFVFGMLPDPETNEADTKEMILQEEKELFDFVMDDDKFWKKANKVKKINSFVSLLEKEHNFLVDKIIFTDGTEYDYCSPLRKWNYERVNGKTNRMKEYRSVMINSSTYSLRNWDLSMTFANNNEYEEYVSTFGLLNS